MNSSLSAATVTTAAVILKMILFFFLCLTLVLICNCLIIQQPHQKHGTATVVLGDRIQQHHRQQPHWMLYSKMPKFSEEEQAELDRIMAGEQIDFSSNVPTKRKNKPEAPSTKPSSTTTAAAQGKKEKSGRVMKPNTEWRTALSNPKAPEPIKKKSPTSRFDEMFKDDTDAMEFDYDDLFEAMQEMESSGKHLSMGQSSKKSQVSIERPGLLIGDTIEMSWFEKCRKDTGEMINDSIVLLQQPSTPSTTAAAAATGTKENVDFLVFFAEPRLITNDFREVNNQFNLLPRKKLKINTLLLNCDEPNDHRKLKKKLKINSQLLCADEKGTIMKLLKCQAPNLLQHMLGIIEIKSNRLIGVWYERDWPTITTKDVIMKVINEYRRK